MRNYVITVKEREAGELCFLVFEPHESIQGLPADKDVMLDMPEGTSIEDARDIARQLNAMDLKIAIR